MGIDSCFEVCRQFSMPRASSLAVVMLIARESKAVSGVTDVEGFSSSDRCSKSSANSSAVMRIYGI